VFVGRNLVPDRVAGLFDVQVGPAEEPVGFPQGADFFRGEPPAFQADLIDAADFGRIAVGDHEGGHVLNDLGAAADDGMTPNAAKLVDPAEAADNGVVLHHHMTGQGAIVGENDMMADQAIVGDVGVGQEIVMVADDGLATRAGSAIDRAELPEAVGIPDFQMGGLDGVFEILGPLADRGEGEESVAIPNHGGAGHADMAGQHIAAAESNPGSDHTVGTDLVVVADLGGWVDEGGGMDHAGTRGGY